MTAFHAFIKSDQILLWTSKKKEEIQKVKSLYCYWWIWIHFFLYFFWAFHFVTAVVMTGF